MQFKKNHKKVFPFRYEWSGKTGHILRMFLLQQVNLQFLQLRAGIPGNPVTT
jgi:hypothetical protein